MQKPIVAYIISREEPDILKENVEHLIYNEKVNYIVITNHVSISENKEVLKPFKDIVIKHYDETDPKKFPQDLWRTRMCRWAIKHLKAEWLVNIDTDEIWFGLQNLRTIPELQDLNPKRRIDSVVSKRVFNHYGTMLDPSKGHSIYNMPYYRLTSKGKRRTIHRGINPKIKIRHGSHDPCLRGNRYDASLDILCGHHFPVRSWDRFLIKTFTSKAPTRSRRGNWRRLYKDGKLENYYKKRFIPPLRFLEKRYKEGKVGYFVPPLSQINTKR